MSKRSIVRKLLIGPSGHVVYSIRSKYTFRSLQDSVKNVFSNPRIVDVQDEKIIEKAMEMKIEDSRSKKNSAIKVQTASFIDRISGKAIDEGFNVKIDKEIEDASSDEIKIEEVDQAKSTFKGFVITKFKAIIGLYEDLTGAHELRLTQNRVIEAESKFADAAIDRTNVSLELVAVDHQLTKLQTEMRSLDRTSERYLEVLKEDWALRQEKARASAELYQAEAYEKHSFTLLVIASNSYREKEKIFMERLRFLKIVYFTAGGIFTLIVSKLDWWSSHSQLKDITEKCKQINSKIDNMNRGYSIPGLSSVKSASRWLISFVY